MGNVAGHVVLVEFTRAVIGGFGGNKTPLSHTATVVPDVVTSLMGRADVRTSGLPIILYKLLLLEFV